MSGIMKQRRRTDATLDESPVPVARVGTIRLHPDDREAITDFRSCIGDLRGLVEDLTRVTRQNTKAVGDHQEVLDRVLRRRGRP